MLKLIGLGLVGLALSGTGASAACSSYPYTLANGNVADASQVMANFNCAALTSGATLTNTSFSGTTVFSNNSGSTITLDKPFGAAATFSQSGTQKFLIEDDTANDNSLGFYYWTGTNWINTVNFKNNGYVGINVNPSYPLDVVGPGGSSGAVDIEGAGSIYSNYWAPNTGSTITAEAGGGSCTYSGGSSWSCSSDRES
jgi:hypothetical protein